MDFKVGEGSSFILNTENRNIDLNVYVADRKKSSLDIEMHFGANGLIPVNMWQQFEFKLAKNRPIEISQGLLLVKGDKNPEIMPKAMFKQKEGVQVQDFLFSSKDELSKNFVGDELVETPGQTFIAKHYRRKNGEQVVDFWISEEVGPIGLVKLVSKSKTKKSQNYSIEFSSLLKNVAPSISPKNAVKMSEKNKKIFKISN